MDPWEVVATNLSSAAGASSTLLPANTLPANAAKSVVTPGVAVTFANGSVWTVNIAGGTPYQLK